MCGKAQKNLKFTFAILQERQSVLELPEHDKHSLLHCEHNLFTASDKNEPDGQAAVQVLAVE